MGPKLIFSAALILLSVTGAEAVRREYSAVEYLKNYALSVCVKNGYSSKETVKDAAGAAGGYVELGSLPIEAYEEAELMSREFLKRKYEGHDPSVRLVLMKCIDFFHSKELDGIARKYRFKK